MEHSYLKLHEWLAVLILIGTILGLALFTSASTTPAYHVLKDYNEGIEVIVKGAVTYPGVYRLPSQMTMQEVLDLAIAKPEADLRRFSLDRPIRKGRIFNIPVRAMLTVHIKGAVKAPVSLQIPKGTRLEELIQLVAFDEKANLQFMRKKRQLKADESIVVPFQDQKLRS